MKSSKLITFLWLLVPVFGIGIFVGFVIEKNITSKSFANLSSDSIRADAGGYRFISPLLACANNDLGNLLNGDAQNLKSSLQTLINQRIKQNKTSEVAVYFRQMNDGSRIDINGSTSFTPGSLLKVPVVMSVLHYSEEHPKFIDKMITFDTASLDNEQYYPPAQSIEKGKKYSIPDLIAATLKYSDNNAAYLLSNSVNWSDLMDSFSDLGIQNPTASSDTTISVDTYASFFRILYNATYLNRNDSESVLNTMSQSTFSRGLVAGVPQGTAVSHKFGEREVGALDQLHDCGIVYYPGSPYLLCVMTRGDNYDDLASVIADISRTVYNSIDSNKQ